jgi:oligoribonuclease
MLGMEIDKNAAPTKLLWMDLEFTDFDYPNSCVLEVSVEITDFDFKTLASYEARIKNNPDKLVKRFALNTFWQDYADNRDTFIKGNDSAKDSKVVEAELIALVEEHFGNEPAILAGNSIHSDRQVVKAHWPALDLKLHYRMLDVTSFKTVMRGKYNVEYDKNSPHRAYEDVQASIAELQFYLDWFEKNGRA